MVAGIGAVRIDRASGSREAFGELLPQQLVKMLAHECSTDQLIAQAELLPVYAARVKWSGILSRRPGQRVLHVVDNEIRHDQRIFTYEVVSVDHFRDVLKHSWVV